MQEAKSATGEQFLVGTLTNSPHRTLECTLPTLNLTPFFQWYVSCLDIGVEKPSKKLFDHTYELLRRRIPDLKRDEIIHIGDHLQYDLLGARNAGFRALLLGKSEIRRLSDYWK